MFGKKYSRALAVATAMTLIMASTAFAGELITAELDGTANEVTVVQGASAAFTISVSATGSAACGSTHTATVHTAFSISNAGAISSATPSSALAFSTTSGTGNCPITWSGAPTALTAAASVSAGTTTPVGTYSVTLSETAGTTTTWSSNGSGGKLDDNIATTLTITVVAPSAPSCTTPADPVIDATGGTAGLSDWYTAAPTISSTATGVQWATAVNGGSKSSFTSTAPTLGTGTTIVYAKAVSGTCVSAEVNRTFKVDPNAPSITDNGFATGTLGSNGWYTTAVAHQFTASEPAIESGLPTMTNPFTASTGSNEGTGLSISSGAVSDLAGNENPGITTSLTYNIDRSNPYNVTFVGGPAAGSSHYWGSVPIAPTCTADDDISGLASCVVSGYSSAVGNNHTMTATATDNAGRQATETRVYSVLAWTLSGFYSPVDMGILNTVKAGATVPLKFEIFSGTTEHTSTASVDTFKVGTVPCGALATAVTDDIEQYSTGGTSLRYDSTGGQFIQNWQVPKASSAAPVGTCYKVVLTTDDGSSLTAYFKTK